MPKLKAEFRKPKLTLYNTNYVALGVLTNKTHLSAHNITLNEQVNETPSLTFDFPMGGLLDGDSLELLIKYKNEYFVIKEIAMSDSDVATMSVKAEHIACELKGIMVGFFEDLIGETPETMWNTVVENCSMAEILGDRYVFETNIVETFRYMGYEDEKSVFEYLLSIAQQFDSCLLFSTDTYGKIHIELLHGDINRSKFIRKGKDLKQLDLTFNTESLFTKMTPFGGTDEDGIEVNIMGVNNGSSYITNYDYYLAKGMTQAQINANPLCNQECIYRNEEIFDEEELLRLAQEELKRLSEPVVEGSISAIDLNVFEGGSYLSPILCERVIVIDKDVKYSISCKITSISLNFENPLESQIGISNVISYSSTLKDLIRNSEIVDKVITGGNNGKPSLNASKVKGIIDGHIAQLKYSMEDAITDVTDAVILFENRTEGSAMYGALAIGSRGILISTQLDRVTNQWVWTTAIDAKGLSTQMVNAIEINGSQIRGDIISSYDDKTWINLNDGTFNLANKITYNGQKFVIKMGDSDLDTWMQEYEENKLATDREINEIKDSLENLDDTLGDAFADGIITEVERIRIEDSLIDLEKEKKDIDDRYALAINDVNLTGDEENNLKTAYTSFSNKYTALVRTIRNIITDDKATTTEKTQYQTKLREYNETIPPLTVAFDEVMKKISENRASTLTEDLKTELEGDIRNAKDAIDDLEDTMLSSFRDGVIDEAEYKAIKENIHRLNVEKLDIDRNYEHLSTNTYIQVKTELLRDFKEVYDDYVEVHGNLTSYIDETIGDRVATEEEIENIRTMLDSYDEALVEYSIMQTQILEEIADATASANLDDYKELVNQDIADVNNRINGLILDVGGAIADNILDRAELMIIENSITALEQEKTDVNKRYTEVIKDTSLKGEPKTNLTSKHNAFNTAHTNLINAIRNMIEDEYATEFEKQVYQNAVETYNTALSELSSAFDKALNEIAKNSAQAIMEAVRLELQDNIDDVQDAVDGLEDYMGNAFRDGILSDAEKESIRTHLLTLGTEKKDVDQQYTSLVGMTDLVGTAKTNLQNAYGNSSKGYVQAYNSLISTINQLLNKTTVNESDRTTLTNAFNNHDAKLATYSQRVNEAIESIAEKKRKDLQDTVSAEITALNDSISLRVTAEQVEAIINDKVDGVEVGGRNLIRNSAFVNGTTDWTLRSDVLIAPSTTFNGHPVIKSQQSGLTSEQWRGVTSEYLPDKPSSFSAGETLTLSCWYRATKSTFDGNLALELKGYKDGDTTSASVALRVTVKKENLKGEWTRISVTKTLENNWANCYVSAWVEKNGTAWFADFKLERGNKATDWTPSIEDTQLQFNALQDLADSLQNQVDGKIQTWYQSADPSTDWTATEKTAHEGDIWHDTLNAVTYRWSGSKWTKLTDADAKEAMVLASSKSQVFTTQPRTPYYVGDLWVQGGDYTGDIMRCIKGRSSGSYTASDWSKASRYTDDSFAMQLEERLDNIVIGGRNLLKNTAEQVIVMMGGTNIVRGLTLTVPASEIVDIDTTLSFDWRYEGDNASNGGTFRIQTGNPQYYGYGDMITISSTNTSGRFVCTKKISSTNATFTTLGIRCDNIVGDMIFTNIKLEKGNTVTDWSPAPEDTTDYTDDLIYDLQGQLDNKIETHNQTADPSTNWTTTELKNKHKGDLWYNPTTKSTKRWSGTAWVDQPEAETLAKTKKRVFTGSNTPTVPYDVGDLWVTSLTNGAGEIRTCKTAKTSSQTASTNDWVSLKYTDDTFAMQLEEKLDNLQIGSRNLIRNSAFVNGTTNWDLSSNVLIAPSTTFNGHPVIKSQQSGLTSEQWRGVTSEYLPDKPSSFSAGETLTLSCWYRATKSTFDGALTLQLKGNKDGDTTSYSTALGVTVNKENLKGQWTRISVTKTLENNWTNCYVIGRVQKNGTAWFADFKLEKGNVVTDWSPAPEDTTDYTDDLIYDLQGQIDNKIETYNQTADPSTNWTTTELKNQHKGDLWYNPSTKLTKRWSGTAWVDQPEAETLAKSKRRVFTSTPTVPYDIGDLWVTKLDGTGEIKTCKTAKTSSQSYASSDWVAPKYTDDTTANNIKKNLENNYYTKTETNTQITTSVGTISSQVTSIKSTVDEQGEAIKQIITGNRCHSLGAKINYSAFSTSNAGEIYLHGYNSSNKATDTDGSITWNGKTVTVTKGMINPDSTFPFNTDVYIFLSGANGSTLGSSTKGMFYDSSAKMWKYAGLIGDTTTATGTSLYSNDYVRVCIGQFNMKSAEEFNYACLYNEPVLLTSVAQQPDIITRLSTAENKITSDAIISAVSGTYLKKTDAETTYAKTSALTQTQTKIEAKFSEGGANLVKNSNFINGLNHWSNWGSPTTRKVVDSSLGFVKALQVTTSNTNQGVTQTISGLEVGQNYTLSAYVNVSSGQCTIQVQNNQQYYGKNSTGTGKQWLDVTFTAETTSAIVRLGRGGGGSNGTYYFTAVQFERGAIRTAWTAHAEELYSGITTIDKDGVTVSHSNANTKSKMSADGFSILDENGDTIAWLTSKNTWTEIKADKVFATNVDNVYIGDANLFVDHSKTVAGDGSSDSPFNNFKALADYLQNAPILKKDLTINVVSTGDVTDHFDLRGIRGNGTIRINLAKTLVLNDSGANQAFYFYGCDVPITINGGRTGYDTTDGALLNTFNYGVFFNQCKYGCVEYLAIDTSGAGNEQWGVIFRGTNGMTRRVDFMGSWNAVLADNGSNVSDHDSCGNCKNAFYAQTGANIVLGSASDNGYKPHGQYVRNVGCVTDLGNRTATASKRSTTSLPPTSDKWKSFSYSDYGYFTPGTDKGVNKNSWNPNGKKVYQGDWGYGNNRGIFTLPNSSIDAFLSGATVLDGSTITIKRATDNGWNSPQWVQLCGTTHTKIGTGTPPVTKTYAWLGELDTGEEKTFTLPKAFVQDLKSGVIKSVMFYTSDGDYYIRFEPVCTLNIKVNK